MKTNSSTQSSFRPTAASFTSCGSAIKRLAMAAALVCASAVGMMAQSESNIYYKCTQGQMTYTTPSANNSAGSGAVKIIGSILEAAVGENTQRTHHPEFAEAVSKAIAGGINAARRFTVIDGGFTQSDLDAHIPALVYDGTISSISTTRRFRTETDRDGKTRNYSEYSAAVSVTFDLKDVYTGQVIKTMNLNSGAYSDGWFGSEENALNSALSQMRRKIMKDLDLCFPLHANILEVCEAKSDKVKSVYIDLGSDAGMEVGLYLLIERVQIIGGKKARKEVARLRVLKVEGEEISLCKITHGGAELKKALDAGETLLITSQNVSEWFGNS